MVGKEKRTIGSFNKNKRIIVNHLKKSAILYSPTHCCIFGTSIVSHSIKFIHQKTSCRSLDLLNTNTTVFTISFLSVKFLSLNQSV